MSAGQDSAVYRVDDIEIDATRACLRRGGVEVHLKPKAFRILVHLLKQGDRVVSKEELMELFWKDTAVTDDALSQRIAEVRRALGDDPRSPAYLKTVPRVGYRFVGSVEEIRPAPVIAPFPDLADLPDAPGLVKSRLFDHRIFWIGALILVAASLGTAALWTVSSHGPPPAVAGQRSIAILRFENRSGQTELDWLKEGLPDMLATTLSRSKSLDVLNRDQVYSRSEKSGKIGVEGAVDIARAKHAQAAIIGSVSKLGDSMRVDVRVYDALKGSLLAAEDVTVERADQLLTQVDFLAARIAARIAPQTRDQDRRVLSSLMTDNLEAYRDYSLGLEKAEALQTEDAVALFEKALALDPGFVMAYARVGYAHAVTNNSLSKGRPYLEKAFRNSSRLTEKERRHILAWYAIANQDYQNAIQRYSELIAEYPNETEAYFRLAMLLRGESRHEEAVEILRRASALDAEDPKLYNALAAVDSEMGRHEDAISMAGRYLALSPGNPNAYDSLALSYQGSGQFERAIEAFGKALDLESDFSIASLHRAYAYAQMGRIRDSIRESLQHAEHGTSDLDRRRGWDQAAIVEWRRGRNQEARSYAMRAVQIKIDGNDPNPAFLRVLGPDPRQPKTIAGRGGRYGMRTVYLVRAEEARLQGRTAEMLGYFRDLLGVKPMWGEMEPYEDVLAEAYYQLGRVDEAIAEYERALKLFPGMARARYHLALAYGQKGRNAEAKEQFTQFLKLWEQADSDLPELADARHRLQAYTASAPR